MKRSITPFNMTLLCVTRTEELLLKPITTLDLYDGNTGEFNDKGLFSVPIFGRVGEKRRATEFARIPLKMKVMHPVIFNSLCRLKSLYKKVMEGTEYAVFDEKEKDFVKSDPVNGQTGYHFFVSHLQKLSPPRNRSIGRTAKIDALDKYRGEALQSNLLVLPAGLRDLYQDEDGRTKMDDCNTMYQRVIAINNAMPDKFYSSDEMEIYDRSRLQLQNAFCEIYAYFAGLIKGKRGFIQTAFASRRLYDGTRGVITSMDISVPNLASNKRAKFLDTIVGLYQLTKAILPKVKYYLNESVLKDVFSSVNGVTELTNMKTLKKEEVSLTGKDLDKWYSPTGFEALVKSLETVERRRDPVIVNGHYLALIFNNGRYFKIFRDIDELPEEYDRKHVRPLSYIELIYYAGYKHWNKHHAVITRYPVTSMGSTIPSGIYVKTTDVGLELQELNADWKPIEGAIAYEAPLLTNADVIYYHDSVSVPPPFLKPLGADFDGDMVSFNAVYTKEANEEIKKLLRSRRHYITPEGRLAWGAEIRTVELALRNISGPPLTSTKGAK